VNLGHSTTRRMCLFFLSFGLLSSAQSNSGANDFSITLDRTGCLGFCPWYSVTILNHGSVRCEGKAYVHVEGIRRKKIPVSDVNKLIQKLRDGGEACLLFHIATCQIGHSISVRTPSICPES
jgi:hypothetical protein